MANTVNIGKTARATAGRGQRRFGSRFSRAAGLAIIAIVALGLAAGVTISRMRPAAVQVAAPAPPVNPYWEYVEDVPIEAPQSVSNPFANDPHVYTQWDFREDRRDDGSAVAPSGPTSIADWEQQERGQVAPGSVTIAPTILPGSCQAGTSDCPPSNSYAPVVPSAVPNSPMILPGDCQPGTSDCPPSNSYTPVGPPPPYEPAGGPQ